MSENNTNDKLYAILTEMVREHSSFFDKETAQYILNRLPTSALLENKYVYSQVENFSLETNFWGFILLKNKSQFNNDNQRINTWLELLKQKDEVTIQSPKFILKLKQKKEQYPLLKQAPEYIINFGTYCSILNFDVWYENQDKSFFNEHLSEIDKVALCLDFLCEKQSCIFHFYDEKKKLSASRFIIDCLKKGKSFLLKNGWHNEESFTKTLLSSKNIQRVLVNLDTTEIEDLFSLDSLGIIIKESHDYEALNNKVNLLNNMFPLAPPEKWLEGFKQVSKKKHLSINIIELFNNKFHKAYGLNIVEGAKGGGTRKETSRTSLPAAESFRDELDFFLPAISKIPLEADQKIHLFNSIMRAEDKLLFKIYLKYMEVPAYDSKYEKEYNQMMFNFNKPKTIVIDDEKYHSYKEFAAAIQANNLNEQLSNQQTTKRTLKI